MRRYIVVTSPSYGGAEKRFFDIFTSLRRRGVDVTLISPTNLVEQLKGENSQLLAQLTGLRDKFRATFQANKELVERLLRGGDRSTTTRTARPVSYVP